MLHLWAQLFLRKSRISHFMPALESLDLCFLISSCGLRLDLQKRFVLFFSFMVSAFVVFTGLVQL